MASGRQLRVWLIVPPLLMASVGLGSYAWQQRALWHLQEVQALSDVLPSFIGARKEIVALVEGFKTSTGGDIGSEDQLISFLQDMAQKNNFVVDTVNVIARKNKQQNKAIPVLNAVVHGVGDFTAIQLYINEVKTEQRLLSVSSVKVSQPSESSAGRYNVEVVFELLVLDEMKALNGDFQ